MWFSCSNSALYKPLVKIQILAHPVFHSNLGPWVNEVYTVGWRSRSHRINLITLGGIFWSVKNDTIYQRIRKVNVPERSSQSSPRWLAGLPAIIIKQRFGFFFEIYLASLYRHESTISALSSAKGVASVPRFTDLFKEILRFSSSNTSSRKGCTLRFQSATSWLRRKVYFFTEAWARLIVNNTRHILYGL